MKRVIKFAILLSQIIFLKLYDLPELNFYFEFSKNIVGIFFRIKFDFAETQNYEKILHNN